MLYQPHFRWWEALAITLNSNFHVMSILCQPVICPRTVQPNMKSSSLDILYGNIPQTSTAQVYQTPLKVGLTL